MVHGPRVGAFIPRTDQSAAYPFVNRCPCAVWPTYKWLHHLDILASQLTFSCSMIALTAHHRLHAHVLYPLSSKKELPLPSKTPPLSLSPHLTTPSLSHTSQNSFMNDPGRPKQIILAMKPSCMNNNNKLTSTVVLSGSWWPKCLNLLSSTTTPNACI